MNGPTHLDLFSGIGGFAIAAHWAGFRTIGFCEIDKYCRKVLAKNFLENSAWIQQGREIERAKRKRIGAAGESVAQDVADAKSIRSEQAANGCEQGQSMPELGGAPIFRDIFDLDGTQFRGVDLVTGGFPCQPFSVAGKRRGAADDRAIWPEMFRVISEARPAWVLGENVPGIIPMELDNVLSDLEGIGYATRAFVIPACAVDARHRRDRLWIVASDVTRRSAGQVCDTTGKGLSDGAGVSVGTDGELQQEPERSGSGVPDTNQQRLEGQREFACGTGTKLNDTGDHCRWLPEPDVGRVAHGILSRVDRLKGLGNAIVPQVAFEILREIRKLC